MAKAKKVTAYSNANIALIKYWGKAPGNLNISSTDSLSMTLDGLGCKTVLQPSPTASDILMIDGHRVEDRALERVRQFLSLVRAQFKVSGYVQVESQNSVPYASGLASSSSAFAALALAANEYYGLGLSSRALSVLARKGSGSAARSIFGSFVALRGGEGLSDEEACADKIATSKNIDLSMIILQCATGPKSIPSTVGMNHSRDTSPFYEAWVKTHREDMAQALRSLESGDIRSLGEAIERSTLKMHAVMATSNPAILYAQPATLIMIQAVFFLRKQGYDCFFTMDAGPHVKIICPHEQALAIKNEIEKISAAKAIYLSMPGPGAFLCTEGQKVQ